MGVILGILTGVSLLASALVAVWMVGAIYFDLCGGAKWGRWVAPAWVVGVVAERTSVIVNGVVVVENATHTGALPGIVLRRDRAGQVG